MSVIERLNRMPKAILAISGMLLILSIGILDYYTGPDIGVSIFYLLPIFLVTWLLGIGSGLVVSLISASSWLTAELLHGKTYSNIYTPYWNALVRLGFFVTIVFLQYALKKEHLHARLDPLTEIGNRRHFLEVATMELQRASRYNRPFTVVYMDIDDFKAVNDTMGHQAGDKLLKIVSTTIKANIRASDTIARLGGDEFALFLSETDNEPAKNALGKLKIKLDEIVNINRWPVTFSFGVATFMMPPDSIDDMIRKVDSLLYEAKKTGKNNIIHGVFG
jgi:diguanylate cyclase (GGDEF)-like protein